MGKPADWVRIVMHQETEKWVSELGPEKLDAFEISGRKWASFPFKTYCSSEFPEFDICEAAPKGQYDIIFAEQVWEHLKYPYRATKNALSALRPGGYFLLTVRPFHDQKARSSSRLHEVECRWALLFSRGMRL